MILQTDGARTRFIASSIRKLIPAQPINMKYTTFEFSATKFEFKVSAIQNAPTINNPVFTIGATAEAAKVENVKFYL